MKIAFNRRALAAIEPFLLDLRATQRLTDNSFIVEERRVNDRTAAVVDISPGLLDVRVRDEAEVLVFNQLSRLIQLGEFHRGSDLRAQAGVIRLGFHAWGSHASYGFAEKWPGNSQSRNTSLTKPACTALPKHVNARSLEFGRHQ